MVFRFHHKTGFSIDSTQPMATLSTDADKLHQLFCLVEQIPHFTIKTGILGTDTIFLYLTLDEKSTWINNIFENSRYAIFRIVTSHKVQ